MKKKIIFSLFLFAVFVLSGFVISNSKQEQDFLTTHIHINLNCKGCLTQRKTNAGCAIFNDGKLLLVKHRFNGKWGFPGGRDKLDGELAFQTAYRETKEETGMIVSIEELIAEFKNNFRLYKCDILKDTNKIDKTEIVEIKFFSKEEIADMMQHRRKEIRYEHQFDILYSQFDKLAKNS